MSCDDSLSDVIVDLYPQVLELCYNELETTSDLCISSLELIHLGLAYNKLSALDLQPSNW